MAAQWYQRAAEQGDAGAQFNLGVIYENGEGVARDDKTAAQWYKLAAEQGNADAQYNLGLMYLWGRGIPKDLIYAYMWADIVASAGEEYSDMLNVVKEEMTPSQITGGKKTGTRMYPQAIQGLLNSELRTVKWQNSMPYSA